MTEPRAIVVARSLGFAIDEPDDGGITSEFASDWWRIYLSDDPYAHDELVLRYRGGIFVGGHRPSWRGNGTPREFTSEATAIKHLRRAAIDNKVWA